MNNSTGEEQAGQGLNSSKTKEIQEQESNVNAGINKPALRCHEIKHSLSALFLLASMILVSFEKTEAQILSDRMVYVAASAGLSRSEDGLKFLKKTSTSQWTPMINFTVGYRFSKYLGLEVHAATMLTQLKAEGTLVSNNEKAEISAKHSNAMISPVFHLPISGKSEVFLRTGVGLLMSVSEINSPSIRDFKKSTSTIGYMFTLGYARKLSNRVGLTVQFDFSDPYGEADVWSGDAGLLNAGIRYSLNHSK